MIAFVFTGQGAQEAGMGKAGHSLGEYSAHVAAGTISFADGLRTVRRRGQYIQQAVSIKKIDRSVTVQSVEDSRGLDTI